MSGILGADESSTEAAEAQVGHIISRIRRGPGWVYLASREDGLYKLGESCRPKFRAKQQGLSLIATFLTVDRMWLERFLHVAYSEYHVGNEWFRLPRECLLEIQSLRVVYGESDIPAAIRSRHSRYISPQDVHSITCEISEETQRALFYRAAVSNQTVGQIIDALVKQHLAD